MKHKISLSIAVTMSALLTLVSLAATEFAQQKSPKRGAVFIGGGANTGAAVNRNTNRARPAAIGAGGAGLYGKSKSRKQVRGRKLIGTTYGGDGQSTLRRGARSASGTQKVTPGQTTNTNQ